MCPPSKQLAPRDHRYHLHSDGAADRYGIWLRIDAPGPVLPSAEFLRRVAPFRTASGPGLSSRNTLAAFAQFHLVWMPALLRSTRRQNRDRLARLTKACR